MALNFFRFKKDVIYTFLIVPVNVHYPVSTPLNKLYTHYMLSQLLTTSILRSFSAISFRIPILYEQCQGAETVNANTNKYYDHTAKTEYRKFEKNISRKELRGPRPNFHIHVSVSDFYVPTIGLPILLQENMWTDRSQTNASGNWDGGRAIPFLGIHKWDFRYRAGTRQ
jgi:hypothetical protein